MKEGVDVIFVSCWLKDAEDYVDVIFVFLSRMDFSISFTSSLHAFCDAKGARRRNVWIQ